MMAIQFSVRRFVRLPDKWLLRLRVQMARSLAASANSIETTSPVRVFTTTATFAFFSHWFWFLGPCRKTRCQGHRHEERGSNCHPNTLTFHTILLKSYWFYEPMFSPAIAYRSIKSPENSDFFSSFTIFPLRITYIRSLIPITSWSSEEIIKMAAPLLTIESIRLYIADFAPTSMPLVGSSKIKSFGFAHSHFERTTFCWFPPLR